MRKAILTALMAATLLPGLAQAQSPELRGDRNRIDAEQRDVNRAIRSGAPGHELRAERQDVREARQEYREDWREYRRDHRDAYRMPAWSGPRGNAYRPVARGYRFQPEFYDRRYWVDARRYHLRPAIGPQRWVRYGNDVLLVDTRSGRVLEVNNGFFY